MFTRKAFIALFAATLIAAAGHVFAGETVYDPRLFDNTLQETEIIDRVDALYPADTSATIEDPRLLETGPQQTTIVNRVDRLYPADTSGTVDVPRLLETGPQQTTIIDRVNDTFPPTADPVNVLPDTPPGRPIWD